MDDQVHIASQLLQAAEAPSSKVLKFLMEQAAPEVTRVIERSRRFDLPVHSKRPQLNPADARSFLSEPVSLGLGALLLLTSQDSDVIEHVLDQYATNEDFLSYIWTVKALPTPRLVTLLAELGLDNWHLSDEIAESIHNEPLSDELVDAALGLYLSRRDGVSEAILTHPELTAKEIRRILAFTPGPDQDWEYWGYPSLLSLLLSLDSFDTRKRPTDLGERAAMEELGAEPSMEALARTFQVILDNPVLDDSGAMASYLHSLSGWAKTQEGVNALPILELVPSTHRVFLSQWEGLDETSIRRIVSEWRQEGHPNGYGLESEEAFVRMSAFPTDLLPKLSVGNFTALTRCLGENPDEWEMVMTLIPQHSTQSIEDLLLVIRNL